MLLRNNEWQNEEQSFRVKVDGYECEGPHADSFYEWGSWITFYCRDPGIPGTSLAIENTYPGHLAFCGLKVFGYPHVTTEDGNPDDEYYTDEYY